VCLGFAKLTERERGDKMPFSFESILVLVHICESNGSEMLFRASSAVLYDILCAG